MERSERREHHLCSLKERRQLQRDHFSKLASLRELEDQPFFRRIMLAEKSEGCLSKSAFMPSNHLLL